MNAHRGRLLAVILAAQAAFVAVGVHGPLSARITGTDVVLKAGLAGVPELGLPPGEVALPPAGSTVYLGYPDLKLPVYNGDLESSARGTLYVPLALTGEVWSASGAPVRVRPESGVYLTCDTMNWQVRCGIETWFVPPGDPDGLGAALASGRALAQLRVDARGNASLISLRAP